VIPLSEVRRLVATVGSFEHPWDIELLSIGLRPGFLIGLVFMTRWRLSDLNGAPRRATGGRGGITLGEPHTHGGQPLQVGCLEVVAARAAVAGNHGYGRPHPALVIGHDQHEIRPIGRLSRARKSEDRSRDNYESPVSVHHGVW